MYNGVKVVSFDYLLKNIDYFKEVLVNDQYFINEIIKLSSDEVFLDIGAYTGDTVADFVKRTKGKYDKI